jgi:hypothetical protein
VVLTLQRFASLAELRNKVLWCRCCDTNVAHVDDVESITDLDKVTAVTIIDAIDEVRAFNHLHILYADFMFVEGTTGSADVFRGLSNGYTDNKEF